MNAKVPTASMILPKKMALSVKFEREFWLIYDTYDITEGTVLHVAWLVLRLGGGVASR